MNSLLYRLNNKDQQLIGLLKMNTQTMLREQDLLNSLHSSQQNYNAITEREEEKESFFFPFLSLPLSLSLDY